MSQKNISISLSDYNPVYQEMLRQKFESTSIVKEILSIDLQAQDFHARYATHLGKYDTVFLLNVIEHLADEQLAMNCLYDLIRPQGTVIILAPSYNWLYCQLDKELGHFRRYNRRRMAALFSPDQFTISHQEYFNLAGIAGWWFFGKLLNRKQLGNEMGGFEKLVPLFKMADMMIGRSAGLSTITVGQKK